MPGDQAALRPEGGLNTAANDADQPQPDDLGGQVRKDGLRLYPGQPESSRRFAGLITRY